ncbi:DUF6279 family lipoprotein [Rhodoferax sp.]|uniref:DUF6279 family lipoprotein n=1 Tax=Rhodoferax sp. TaxID=50421 RepID=UPI0017933F60|nr:DUF6279 family lipoprotein [Rhodoferax sp.]MBA3058474.1 hypothetical protein [Rhodoferax sp.]
MGHIIGALPARLALGLRLVLWSVLPALLLSGCSALKLGYNNAPELGYWWFDGFLDFNDPQSTQVRVELAGLQAWHRQSELPRYVSILQKLQRLAPTTVTAGQLCEAYGELKPRLQAILDQAEPGIAALAPSLSPEQLLHLQRQLEKRSEKWRSEWLAGSLDERNERRVKQLAERAEVLYGSLGEGQLVLLRERLTALPFDADLRARESQRRHRDVLQTLRQIQGSTPSDASARSALRAWLARTVNSPDAVYRKQQDMATQATCQSLAALHNSTTPAQRLAALKTLRGYEAEARSLLTTGR